MKIFIRFGVFVLFMILLNAVVSEEDCAQSIEDLCAIQPPQITALTQTNNLSATRKEYTGTRQIPFDQIDHTFSQTPDLKYLFPVTLKYPIYRPERKAAKSITPNIASVFSCPVTHYVFGLRKIII